MSSDSGAIAAAREVWSHVDVVCFDVDSTGEQWQADGHKVINVHACCCWYYAYGNSCSVFSLASASMVDCIRFVQSVSAKHFVHLLLE